MQHTVTSDVACESSVRILHYMYTHHRCILYLHLDLLERVLDHIVLPNHNLALLLCHVVLHPHLPRPLVRELAYEPRIPEFTRNTQILAAAHQGVGLAALGRGGDAVGVKVLLLATGDGD